MLKKTAKDEDGIEHLVKVPVEPLAARHPWQIRNGDHPES